MTLTCDRGYEAAEASQFAGGGKSMQKPIGFRPDLAESLGISQPVGFRPDLAESLGISQPVGFRPDLAEFLGIPQSLGFRHELPGLASSSIGCRSVGPEMSFHGAGSPIHVELSESASGETLGCEYEKEGLIRKDDGMRTDPFFWPREGKPKLSYSLWYNPLGDTGVSALGLCSMAHPRGSTSQDPVLLSPRPNPFVYQHQVGESPEAQGKVQEPASGSKGPVHVKDWGAVNGGDRASEPCKNTIKCAQDLGTWRLVNGAKLCLSQGPEEDRHIASVGPSEWCACQGGLSSGVLARQGHTDSGPPETGALPGCSELRFVGLDKSSPRGESTPPSTVSQAPDKLLPSDSQNEPLKPLVWTQGLHEIGTHEACKVISSQCVVFPEHAQGSKERGRSALSAPAFEHTLRQDLSSTLPGWLRARLGTSERTVEELCSRPKDPPGLTSCQPVGRQLSRVVDVEAGIKVPGNVALIGSQDDPIAVRAGQVAASLSHMSESSEGTTKAVCPGVNRQAPRATWFSRVHVCGTRCFPPITAKKVQAGVAGMTQVDSSSESSLYEDSDVEALSPHRWDMPFASDSSVTMPECSSAVLGLCATAQAQEAMHAQPFPSLDPSTTDLRVLPWPTENSGSCLSDLGPNTMPLEDNKDLSRTLRFSSLPLDAEAIDQGTTLWSSLNSPRMQDPSRSTFCSTRGSLSGQGGTDPSHKHLGFRPDLPRAQGPLSSINPDPSHEFFPQVQGSPCRAVNLQLSRQLLGFCQDSLMAQGSLAGNVNPGPEQYQIHSDDDDCSPTSKVESHSWWEQSCVDLSEPLPHQSRQHEPSSVTAQQSLGTASRSAKVGPSILQTSQYALLAQAYEPGTAKVTWTVPLPCEWPAACRTTNLDRDPFFLLRGCSVASQLRESGFAFLPNLAGNLLCRLLTSQMGQEKERQFTRLLRLPQIIEANSWGRLSDISLSSTLSAPARPQAWSFQVAMLPGYTSISGNDSGNALAQACIEARWGETTSPDTNFKISLSVEPGQDSGQVIRREELEDPNPKSLRFSPSLTCAVPRQSEESGQGELCPHPSHKPVRFSPSLCQAMQTQGVHAQASKVHLLQVNCAQPGTQAGKVPLPQVSCAPPGVQAGKVHLSQQACSQPEAQAGDVHLSQQVCSHPEVQTGKVHLSQQACSQPEAQAGKQPAGGSGK